MSFSRTFLLFGFDLQLFALIFLFLHFFTCLNAFLSHGGLNNSFLASRKSQVVECKAILWISMPSQTSKPVLGPVKTSGQLLFFCDLCLKVAVTRQGHLLRAKVKKYPAQLGSVPQPVQQAVLPSLNKTSFFNYVFRLVGSDTKINLILKQNYRWGHSCKRIHNFWRSAPFNDQFQSTSYDNRIVEYRQLNQLKHLAWQGYECIPVLKLLMGQLLALSLSPVEPLETQRLEIAL